MKEVTVAVYSSSKELPSCEGKVFFHSSELFRIYENTPRHSPMMAVARRSDGTVAGHILAVVRRRSMWLPPFMSWHCRILGEGEYDVVESERQMLFGKLMEALVRKMPIRVSYIELSPQSSKMFGHSILRGLGFFPVNWMNIHNSLHSKSPEERASERTLTRIKSAMKKGVETREVKNERDFHEFMSLLKAHNYFKPKRFIPDDAFFRDIARTGVGKLMITNYKSTTIGCCAYAVSNNNSYHWYAGFIRKRYKKCYPAEVTIWAAIKKSYNEGIDHFCFLDVGLPYRANKLRDFILKFGGKPVSSFRWFRFNNKMLNALISTIWGQ